jgi:hypothetical protein
MTNKTLYNFCIWNDTKTILELLYTFDDINVLYENGSFFYSAISKENIEVCKALLDYFENKQFRIKDVQYQEERSKLIEILENATDSVELSIEMKNILSSYINFESSEDDRLNDSFFNDYHLQDQPYYEEEVKTPRIIKSKSAGYLNTDTDSNNEVVDIIFYSQKEHLHEVHSSGDLIESDN